jgi:hypothetical protein
MARKDNETKKKYRKGKGILASELRPEEIDLEEKQVAMYVANEGSGDVFVFLL